MISHDHRCIFVHIPKTAGNSVNRVFGVGWQDHKDLQRYRDELTAEEFATYFKFAIVRNPWDRLFSDYNYQLKKSRDKDSKLFLFTATGTKRNFAQWVDVALAEPDFYDPRRWGGEVSTHIHRWSPQCDWISVAGRPAVDYIAHLERLSDDFPVICRRLGLEPVSLPHRNRRLHLHYSHYYDATTRSIVANYYARDIELFGYEFHHAFLRVSFAWPMARPAAAETPAPGPAAEPARTRVQVYSFPRLLRATARHAWFGRSVLAAAASVAFFVHTFSALATTAPLAAASRLSLPQEFVRQSVQQAISSDVGPAGRVRAPLASATHATRTLNHLRVSVEPSPATFMGFVPLVVTDLPAAPAATPRRRNGSIVPPQSDVRSGSSRVPRWWWNRNGDNFP